MEFKAKRRSVMLPEAYVIHSIPGRTRIRIPSKRHENLYFRSVEEKLARCDGVVSIHTNPLAGSVLVLHSGDPTVIVVYARANDLFEVVANHDEVKSVSERLLGRVHELDKRVRVVSAGTLDLNSASFVVLGCAGVVQLLRRNVWPAGMTLLWYAANLLRQSTRHEKGETSAPPAGPS
jgi:hypothetical protein